MKIIAMRQTGGSVIVNLIILALVAYGLFVAIQYVPQWVEAKSIGTILDNMQSTQGSDPVRTVNGARDKVIRMLQINEMNDMTESFEVSRAGDDIVVTFSFDRELNLLYETRPIHFERSVRLAVNP
jgi:hypothetical protein